MRNNLVMCAMVGLILAIAGIAQAELVGQWTFDGVTGLEDSSANPAANGALYGGASLVTAATPMGGSGNKVLQVVKGNNTAQRFQVADPGTGSKFDLTNAATIALWVYLDPTFENPNNSDPLPLVNNAEGLVWKDQSSSWALGNNGQQYKMRVAEWGTGVGQNGPSTEAGNLYGQWYHLAFTYDGSVAKIYINGDEVLTRNTSITFNQDNLPVTIGGRSQNGYSITGMVDDVRIYNTALSQSDIQAMMTPTPEPATMSLLVIGGLAALIRRKRS